MAGIFQGIKDMFTGGGGAPGSQVNDMAVQEWINRSLNDQQQARLMAGMGNARFEDQFASQQNLLPFLMEQLGYGMDRTGGQWGNEVGNFRYQGTNAQRGLDDMTELGRASLGAQYANAGYDFQQNPDGSYSTPERSNSQRYQFLTDQDQAIAQSQRLRDDAYQRLISDHGPVEGIYNEAYNNLQGNQTGQQEALDATRRQLRTAEAYQPAVLNNLGYSRGADGSISNDPNSRMGQYQSELYNQMVQARGLQGAGIAQMGLVSDGQGGYRLDPNSNPARIQQAYQDLLRHGQQEVGTAGQVRNASMGRLGMMQDASGNWVNDPNSNEMRSRSLQGDFLTRAQTAMQGNAPINPGLQRQLAAEEQQLRGQLAQNLGPGYQTTSAGMEALANFQKRRSELMYNEQQDAMNQGVQNALGLQGSNLSTLAALYGVSEPVLRAITGATNTANSATNAQNQTNLSNAQTMGQLQQNVMNPMTTAGNMNAQTLAALYGMTGAAQSAAGQLGNLTNQNISTNQNAYANLNAMGINNRDALARMYGTVSNLGGQTQNAINSRAQGALSFQNSNADILRGIPQAQQQLYGNANAGRMQSLSALMPATQGAFNQDRGLDLIRLYGSLGGQGGQLGLGSAGAVDEGNFRNYQTNINNVFWQNFMRSFGQSAGSYVGSGGMGGGSGGSIFT